MVSRRGFIAASAVGLAFSGFARVQAHTAGYVSEVYGYGPLIDDSKGVFDLPRGFSYSVVSRFGDEMDDGLFVPDKADGMGCFAAGGDRVVLVRNHELKPTDVHRGAFGHGRALAHKVAADRIYDHTDDGLPFLGGTTTLVYDLRRRRLVRSHLSLAGTSTNCAGGITPRGSWLTCEETTQAAGVEAQKDHGWVFEVPASGRGLADPEPIKAMGRFRHEAAATDPRTGIVYLTEDVGDGCGLFYRYLPNDPAKLLAGGRLQALGLAGGAEADPRNWEGRYWSQGDWRDGVWIDLDGVENPYEDLRHRGHAAGAAWFARGEGIYWGEGELYFTCTGGGPGALGQIMRYRPSLHEGQPGEKDEPGRLQLFVEPKDKVVLEMGDNLAVSPWGHLMVCEDRQAGVNHLRGVTPEGKVYTMGRNALGAPHGGDANTELAGVCFSPDGTTMFLNLYFPAATLAITGPWSRFRAA